MRTIITVKDVLESHDCAGRKLIQVTSMAEDEIVPARYNLAPGYMTPIEKLILSTVSPMDQVIVEASYSSFMDTVVGEYVGNLFDAGERTAVCKCGTPLDCDGYHIYCRNQECPLTMTARIMRLSYTVFFEPHKMQQTFCGHPYLDKMSLVSSGSDIYYERPFEAISNPRFWGESIKSLETILLSKPDLHISMATFLTQPLFQEFIENIGTTIPTNSSVFQGLSLFFGMMDQIVFRRDYESNIQNLCLRGFLHGLGIESLTDEIITLLILAEQSLGQLDEVMLPYVYYLSDARALRQELGIIDFVADNIAREFYYRRHEFYDIFLSYSDPQNISEIFHKLDPNMGKG